MPGYTKKNLKADVGDSAEQHGLAPNLEARFGSGDLGLEKLAFSYQRLGPNFRLPFGHKHEEQEEVYVVVAGSGRMKLDDEVIDIAQWDAVRLSPDVTRSMEAGDEGLEILAIGAPNLGGPQADTEPIPGWWSD